MKKFSTFNFKFSTLLILTGFFLFPSSTFAARLFLDSSAKDLKTEETFIATLSLDTEGQYINAVEGDIKYNKDLLKAEVINIGTSFISLWIEKPDTHIPGVIHFSGIVPGGVNVANGELFKIIFRGQHEGWSSINIEKANLLLNDGEGTRASTKFSNSSIKIFKGSGGITLPVVVQDTLPPEKFRVSRVWDESVYDNKSFIVFNTLDKESGITHYDVCEYWNCLKGESPFLLNYQNPFYYIVVRAYDVNDNYRDAVLISPYLIFLVLFLVVVIVLSTLAYKYRRYFKFSKL